MKKVSITLILSILFSCLYSQSLTPKVCFFTTSGPVCSASTYGAVNPCDSVYFVVKDYMPFPTGYDGIEKFEWFVNNILVKSTTEPTDPVLKWGIQSKSTEVYCNVTYKKNDGTLSSAYTSNKFTPIIKGLNFNSITTSSLPPNYGCADVVSYSLTTYTCTSFCDYTYTVGSYNITWQAPAGWIQTSISANGNNVSFIPDASSAGVLTATITLPCGFTDTRTFTITRGAEAPIFTTPNVVSCTSSASISINSVCGASNYTYSIIGSPGVTFTGNGLQSLTTTNTTVNFSISGGSSLNTIKVKANYINNNSSVESNASLTAGAPAPGPINVISVDPYIGKIQVEVEPIPGATDYRWYKNGILQTIYHSTFAQIPITRNLCDVSYSISVKATTACGTSPLTYQNVYVPPCGNSFSFSPNPATNDITVSIDPAKAFATQNTSFDEVRIYDLQGNLKKYQTFNKIKAATINIAGLTNGTYFIEIINGTYKEKHQLLIQK